MNGRPDIELTDTHGPLDERRIAELEERFGARLPEDYRRFLLQHNGGRPDPADFRLADRQGAYTDSRVEAFLSVYDGEHFNFEKVLACFKGPEPRIPANLVPIARDPFGNLICLSIAGPDGGTVYFWDHERESEGEPTYDNVDRIADSFGEFLAALYDSGTS